MDSQAFQCEIEKAETPDAGRVNTVTCHGRLVAGSTDILKEAVKPLISEGGKTIVDLADVQFIDSMGLGSLVGLKVSALGAGYCSLEFRHLSKRVQELVSMTHLTDLFKQQS
jgi:anti-sigma B factor antagonist